MDAYIYGAIRTPRGKGKREGALYEVRPIDLLSSSLTALQERTQLDTSQVDDVIIGCVTPVADQGANIAKAALMYAGWSNQVPGVQINRFCSSGLDAINMAAGTLQHSLQVANLSEAAGASANFKMQLGMLPIVTMTA